MAGNAIWLIELPSVVMECNKTIHSSTKMKPIDAFEKANDKLVYSNIQDQRVWQKPIFKLGQLVRAADIKEFLVEVIQQNTIINYIQ